MPSSTVKNRKKKVPKYQSFRLQKRIKPKKVKPLPSSWRLWVDSISFTKQNWKKVGTFLVIYMLLYLVLVRGLGSAIDFGEVKEGLTESGEANNVLVRSLIFFGLLVGTSNSASSDTAAAYQSVVFIVGSLAFVWLLRALQGRDKKSVRVRDGFYLGMYPLVPVVIVLFVLLVEAIPLSIATFLLNTLLTISGISIIESFVFVVLAGLVSLLSLYLISSTWAALYIVSLPNAEPVKAIRASYNLMSVHRWQVMRRLLALVLFLILAAAILIIPLLMILPDGFEYIAEYGFFAYMMVGFTVAHTYLYSLYKSLL